MSIRAEADRLIRETSLIDILRRHGTPVVTGSYSMDIMAWRDLDLYLLPCAGFDPYAMIADLNAVLRPVRFDGFVRENGVFYGCETAVSGARWNVDIWIRTEAQISESIAYCSELLRRMDEQPGAREAIVAIKTGLIAEGMYGFDKHPSRHFHSRDIYDAVLNEGLLSVQDLLQAHPL